MRKKTSGTQQKTSDFVALLNDQQMYAWIAWSGFDAMRFDSKWLKNGTSKPANNNKRRETHKSRLFCCDKPHNAQSTYACTISAFVPTAVIAVWPYHISFRNFRNASKQNSKCNNFSLVAILEAYSRVRSFIRPM